MQVRYSGNSWYVTSRSEAQIIRVCSNNDNNEKKKHKRDNFQMFVHVFHKQTPTNVIAIENATPLPSRHENLCNLPLFEGGVRLALINLC